MNYKRIALAAVAAWVVSLGVGFVINDLVLADLYMANQGAMRLEADLTSKLPIGFVFLLIGFFAFAFAYAKGYEGGSGVVEGLRFGAVISLIVTGFGIVWQYVLYPISGDLVVAIVVDSIVELTIYGGIVGVIYKPLPAWSRRSSPV